MGARFEATITHVAEQMKVKGEPWTPFEQRAADALVALCDPAGRTTTSTRRRLAPLAILQVAVPLHGPAEIAGVPIADCLLEQLRANVSIEPVLVDDDGIVLGDRPRARRGSRQAAPGGAAARRAVSGAGCGRRRGLEAHHLVPRSWGGTDEITNLAAVCPAHHRLLVPARAARTGRQPQPARRTRARHRTA